MLCTSKKKSHTFEVTLLKFTIFAKTFEIQTKIQRHKKTFQVVISQKQKTIRNAYHQGSIKKYIKKYVNKQSGIIVRIDLKSVLNSFFT